MLCNKATFDFICSHRFDDTRKLALSASRYPDVDMTFALKQIAGRQIATKKIPSWAEIDEIGYPPHLSMEQCSSETTAIYKQKLLNRWLQKIAKTQRDVKETVLTDLTGGMGVDFSMLSACVDKAVYVEQNEELCGLAKHNFEVLQLANVSVIHAQAENYMAKMEGSTVIFADPARRNEQGGKTVFLQDCVPDVLQLLPQLLDKTTLIILKLSPMLDHHLAVKQIHEVALGAKVAEVHILAVHNECKELLIVVARQAFCDDTTEGYQLYCVNDNQELSVHSSECYSLFSQVETQEINAGHYLYEPFTPMMKAGCFGVLCQRWGVKSIATHSHLFLSTQFLPNFPGRCFQIKEVSSFNKKMLRTVLKDINQAHIAVRNFPLAAPELRKKLKLKDGGDTYLFATTDEQGQHILLICQKESV